MGRKEIIKDVLLYCIWPENTTESGGGGSLLDRPSLSGRQAWLGPLKTVIWMGLAVALPLLLCALFG